MSERLSIKELLNEYELSDLIKSVRLRKISFDPDDSEDVETYQDTEEAIGTLAKILSSLIKEDKRRKNEVPSNDNETFEVSHEGLKKLSSGVYIVTPEAEFVEGDKLLTALKKNNLLPDQRKFPTAFNKLHNLAGSHIPKQNVVGINTIMSKCHKGEIGKEEFFFCLSSYLSTSVFL